MFIWGACALLCLLTPAPLAMQLWPRLTLSMRLSAVTAALTALLALPLQTAIVGNGWTDATNPSTLRAVLSGTTIGTAWLAQTACGILLFALLFTPDRMCMKGLMCAAALGLICLTLSGHAAMDEGWLGLAHRSNDALHVLAAGGWLGALPPLLPILRTLKTEEWRKDATTALIRFSNVGHAAVALVLASGAVNTALILRRLPTGWSSPYQRLLIIKIALVALMVIAATVNRYVFVPLMRRSPAFAVDAIRIGSIVEILLGMAAIACVAVFGMLEPA